MQVCKSRESEIATARPAGPAPRIRTSVGFCRVVNAMVLTRRLACLIKYFGKVWYLKNFVERLR